MLTPTLTQVNRPLMPTYTQLHSNQRQDGSSDLRPGPELPARWSLAPPAGAPGQAPQQRRQHALRALPVLELTRQRGAHLCHPELDVRWPAG